MLHLLGGQLMVTLDSLGDGEIGTSSRLGTSQLASTFDDLKFPVLGRSAPIEGLLRECLPGTLISVSILSLRSALLQVNTTLV